MRIMNTIIQMQVTKNDGNGHTVVSKFKQVMLSITQDLTSHVVINLINSH